MALYDLGYGAGVARRLLPGVDLAPAFSTYARVTEAWNADQVRVLAAAAGAAAAGRDAIAALVRLDGPRVRALDTLLLRTCDEALTALERDAERAHGGARRAHARSRLLSAVALSMGLSVASCHCDFASKGTPASDAAAAGGTGGSPATDAAPGKDAAASDADAWLDAGPCLDGGALDAIDLPCLNCVPNVRLTVDRLGRVVAATWADGTALDPSVEACLLDFLSAYCFPSVAGSTQEVTPHCWIA
ncbi:MAG TPA: hypothetical protein VG389_14530 [Myxococcota bacterium]|jgi:hypothetical protein|nr:hypothetical protein [Myxococcota bacterium]